MTGLATVILNEVKNLLDREVGEMVKLFASAGEVDLKSPVGGWMTGFSARIKPSVATHDPLMARAVLLDDGETRLTVVSCDLIGFTPLAGAAMRRRIAAKSGIPAANIFICCTHTHSGPASMPFRGALGHVDNAWLSKAQDKIVELVAGLPTALAPARMGYSSTRIPDIGYNRQDQSHPIDEELFAIAIDGDDGLAIATLVNYATHAVVLGPSNLAYSGDFPGEAARQIQALRGGVGLYLQGACGDVDPLVYRERGWGSGTFEDTHQIGQRLAEAAAGLLSGALRTDDVCLRVGHKIIQVSLDPPPSPDALAALVAGFGADRERARRESNSVDEQIALAMLGWAGELQRALQAGAVPQTVPAELFAAGINDLWLVGAPFEAYSDIGLGIKAGFRPGQALFVGYANGLIGYCPTRWAKDQGGYGADSSARWFSGLLTAIGYGADELIIREGIALAKSL